MIDILYIKSNIVSNITDISDIPHLTVNFRFWCRNGFSNFNSVNSITAAFVTLAIRLSSSIYSDKPMIMR